MNDEIQKSFDWLLNWYNERSTLCKSSVNRYLTDAVLQLINDRLKDAHVVLSDYLEEARPIEPTFALLWKSKPMLSAEYVVGKVRGRSL